MKTMRLLLRSKGLHVAVALLLLYIPIALLVPPAYIYIIIGSVLFFTSIAVIHAYWPPFRVTLQSSIDEIDRVDVLTMGIFLMFVSLAGRELYVTFYRVLYVGEGIRSDEYFLLLSFFRYMAVVAAILALSARRVLVGPYFMRKVPGWPHAVVGVATGIAAGVGVITYFATGGL